MISNYPGVAAAPAKPVEAGIESASDFRYQPDPFDAAERIREEADQEQVPSPA